MMSRISLRIFKPLYVGFAVCLLGLLAACGSDSSTNNGGGGGTVEVVPQANDDVANSLAAIIALDNGGVAEQIVDVVSLASEYGLRFDHLILDDSGTSDLTYDSFTGTWEWAFVREYSSANGLYSARVERHCQWKFLNKNGQPQVRYIHGTDTAYTIELFIVEGEGHHHLPQLSQALLSITGHLTATGANTSTLSVNGSIVRVGLDTITTRYAVRTIAHVCTLSVVNVACTQDTTIFPWRGISGTINGRFVGDVTFSSGDAYVEDSVDRQFSIAIDSGDAGITVGDSTWSATLRRGEIQLPPDPETGP